MGLLLVRVRSSENLAGFKLPSVTRACARCCLFAQRFARRAVFGADGRGCHVALSYDIDSSAPNRADWADDVGPLLPHGIHCESALGKGFGAGCFGNSGWARPFQVVLIGLKPNGSLSTGCGGNIRGARRGQISAGLPARRRCCGRLAALPPKCAACGARGLYHGLIL